MAPFAGVAPLNYHGFFSTNLDLTSVVRDIYTEARVRFFVDIETMAVASLNLLRKTGFLRMKGVRDLFPSKYKIAQLVHLKFYGPVPPLRRPMREISEK
jgi:hypothetical protein